LQDGPGTDSQYRLRETQKEAQKPAFFEKSVRVDPITIDLAVQN
jgi:hypothetical protein